MNRVLSVVAALALAATTGCAAPDGPPGGPSDSAVAVPTTAPSTASATPSKPSATATPTRAPEGTTLRKIQDRGRLVVGVKYDAPTFGLLNPTTNTLEGFDVDLAKVVARELLGSEDRVMFKQTLSKDRIPYLEQHVVDVVASTMTATDDRAKQVLFSDTYYVAGQTLIVPKASDITGLKSLAGKSVGTVKGSTSEQNLRANAPQATVVLFDTYSEAVATMDTGRLHAVTADDTILFGFASQAPERYKVVGGNFTLEPYAMAVAKGDAALLDAVNGAIRKAVQSGEWARLYDKNFGRLGLKAPAPPPRDWREVGKRPPATG